MTYHNEALCFTFAPLKKKKTCSLFFKKYLFIYLAVLGLSFVTQGLFLVAVCELSVAACGTWFPDQELNPES